MSDITVAYRCLRLAPGVEIHPTHPAVKRAGSGGRLILDRLGDRAKVCQFSATMGTNLPSGYLYLGRIAERAGNHEDARDYYSRGMALYRQLGDPEGERAMREALDSAGRE